MIFCQISKILYYKFQKDGEAQASPASLLFLALYNRSLVMYYIHRICLGFTLTSKTQDSMQFSCGWVEKKDQKSKSEMFVEILRHPTENPKHV